MTVLSAGTTMLHLRLLRSCESRPRASSSYAAARSAAATPPRSRAAPQRVSCRPQATLRRCSVVVASASPPVAPRSALSSAGRAAAVTGAYISVVGAALLVAPLRCVGLLFCTEGVSAAWARLLAVLCLAFGSYYGGAALLETRGCAAPVAFYQSTVAGRVVLCTILCTLYATGLFPLSSSALPAPLPVCLLAGTNALGAAAMHFALKRDAAKVEAR